MIRPPPYVPRLESIKSFTGLLLSTAGFLLLFRRERG